jgi:hypothetical protein
LTIRFWICSLVSVYTKLVPTLGSTHFCGWYRSDANVSTAKDDLAHWSVSLEEVLPAREESPDFFQNDSAGL